MQEQAKLYRYAVYAEGACGWADRLKAQLASGTVMLLQETPCWEFFQPLLQPGHHYIPISGDLSNLPQVIQSLRIHDEGAREVSLAAAQFVHEHLREEQWDRYIFAVLKRYARLMGSTPFAIRPNARRFVRETKCPNMRNYLCDDSSSFK